MAGTIYTINMHTHVHYICLHMHTHTYIHVHLTHVKTHMQHIHTHIHCIGIQCHSNAPELPYRDSVSEWNQSEEEDIQYSFSAVDWIPLTLTVCYSFSLQHYLNKYKFANAETNQLWEALQEKVESVCIIVSTDYA